MRVSKNKINRKFLKSFLFWPCLWAGLFLLPNFCWAENYLIINEIQVGNGNNEFIELYNPNKNSVDLTGFKLNKKTSTGTESTLLTTSKFNGIIVPAENYFLISHSSYGNTIGANLTYPASYSISNNNTIILYDEKNNVLDKVGFGTAKDYEKNLAVSIDDDKSIGRKDFIDTDDNSVDFSITKEPTPGKDNTFSEPETPKIYSSKIRINEILPHPSNKEEFIELYNSGEIEDLTGWWLEDRAKKKCSLVGNILEKDFLVWKNCGISLNDTQGETLTLYNPVGEIVSSVSYDGSAKEDVSYNFDGTTWRWSRFLTPGAENVLNDIPEVETKKDNKAYVGMNVNFSTKSYDKNNDKLKFTWDFGDGHKSYLKETKHKFEKAGKYKVILTVFDGSESEIKEFDIEVKKYPKVKMEITAFAPNPKGQDTESEWIEIKNNSKKKVNLNGWSVATGWDKLINHPITEDLILKAGETKRITRAFSKFTLNNKKSKIELRYPNGEPASKVKYNKKKETVADDEIYSKNGKSWNWNKPARNAASAGNASRSDADWHSVAGGNNISIENVTESDSDNNVEEDPLDLIDDLEIQANAGKSSKYDKQQLNKIILLGFNDKIKNPQFLPQETGIILGESIYREKTDYKTSSFLEKANYFINQMLARMN